MSGIKLYKTLVTIVSVALLTATVFGIFHFGMDKDMNNGMARCPFMVGMTICKMTPLEHLAAWQNIFTTLPTGKNLVFSILLLSLYVIIFSLIDFLKYFKSPNSLSLSPHKLKEKLFSTTLQEAFSNGILNSKAF